MSPQTAIRPQAQELRKLHEEPQIIWDPFLSSSRWVSRETHPSEVPVWMQGAILIAPPWLGWHKRANEFGASMMMDEVNDIFLLGAIMS